MHATPPRAAPVRAALAAVVLALAACGGGSGGLTPPPPQCKGADEACGVAAECCSGGCLVTGACDCSAVGERCGTSEDCCTSLGPTRCNAGTCVSGARPLGDVCDLDGECASLNCDLTGHCAAACSWTLGSTCTDRMQCCAPMGCIAGQCSLACGGACTTDAQCCSDETCRAGQCQTGLCGDFGDLCHTDADCCKAAQGGKNYHCTGSYGSCDIGQPGSTPPEACATDADCAAGYPCRGGYCHYPDGSQHDGWWCLDGRECAGGFCSSTQAGVPGTCCSGAGASCTAGGWATICCDPLACTGPAGAQHCGTCLDFTNSGPQGDPQDAGSQCATGYECCENRNLTCTLGECCTLRGYPCTAGTGTTECCYGDTCGTVTTYQGPKTQCCGDYGSACYGSSACCDGLLCSDSGTGQCLKGPGQACNGTGQCAESQGVACNEVTGTCCIHAGSIFTDCASDADCCSGLCDPTYHECVAAPEYGKCLTDGDCQGPDYDQDWTGQVCGGGGVPDQTCCPVPGDTCASQPDCCDPTDACRAPLSGADTTTPRCCGEAAATCSKDIECCTGTCWIHTENQQWTGRCCAYSWLTTFTCTSDAECCDSSTYSGVYARERCGTDRGEMRCCATAGQSVGTAAGAADRCCSGRADGFGYCR